MRTPTKLSVEEFFVRAQSFLAANYTKGEGSEGLVCKHCRSTVKMEPVRIPLHEAMLDRCEETDTAQFMKVPYCPKCEEPPSHQGCIHVPSPAAFFEWCKLHKEVSELFLITIDRRGGRRESGIARRKLVRECFEGDVTPETHHAFARPDLHKVLAEFGYWLDEFGSDFSTYVRRSGKDYIETHRLDGSWRHVAPGEKDVEGQGSESLKAHLSSS